MKPDTLLYQSFHIDYTYTQVDEWNVCLQIKVSVLDCSSVFIVQVIRNRIKVVTGILLILFFNTGTHKTRISGFKFTIFKYVIVVATAGQATVSLAYI